MESWRSISPVQALQALTQHTICRRYIHNASQQCTQVQPCSTRDHRQLPTSSHLLNDALRRVNEVGHRVVILRRDMVHKMMRDALSCRVCRLGRTGIETPVDLQCVTPDDLAIQTFGKGQSQLGFTGTRGSEHDQQARRGHSIRCNVAPW
jgi:hypothetical protein